MNLSQHEADALALVEKHGGIRPASRASGIPYTTLNDRVTSAKRKIDEARPTSRMTVLFMPDKHRPYEDRRAIDAIYNYVHANFAVTHYVNGGDEADLFEFSGFPSTPKMHPDEEIEYVIRGLEDDCAAFPGAGRTFILGNHEKRLCRYIQNHAPKLARLFGDSIPEIFELERMGYRFVDNEHLWETTGQFFKIGKLTYIHGHELRGGGFKYTAQRWAEQFRVNIIAGHLHTSEDARPLKDLEGHTIRVWMTGCACSVLPRYKPGASHVHGFAVIEYDKDGSGCFQVYNHILDENYKVR
jgi:hypothetical protein